MFTLLYLLKQNAPCVENSPLNKLRKALTVLWFKSDYDVLYSRVKMLSK